jgi:membrane-associated phospholipid phosphatase
MLMEVFDYISMSVGLLYAIPFILYFLTGNPIHFKAFLGVSGTTIISETLKYFFIGNASPRPKGAMNCDLLCKDGNQEGRPGMPSSHSAIAVFFSSFYFLQTNSPIIHWLLVIYAGLVVISRLVKRCHTVAQVLVGGLMGFGFSLLLVRNL